MINVGDDHIPLCRNWILLVFAKRLYMYENGYRHSHSCSILIMSPWGFLHIMTHSGKWDPFYEVPKLFSVIKKIMWPKKHSNSGSPNFHDLPSYLLWDLRVKCYLRIQKWFVEMHGWVLQSKSAAVFKREKIFQKHRQGLGVRHMWQDINVSKP